MQIVEDLEVYKLSYNLVLKIYKMTEKFPRDELFGLVSQMRRAAVSITSNLSEGGARSSTKELKNFACISRGSVAEIRTQVNISKDLGFIGESEYAGIISIVDSVKKMLNAFIKSLDTKIAESTHHSPLTTHP